MPDFSVPAADSTLLVCLVTGPPAAGKSTFARACSLLQEEAGVTVVSILELDDFLRKSSSKNAVHGVFAPKSWKSASHQLFHASEAILREESKILLRRDSTNVNEKGGKGEPVILKLLLIVDNMHLMSMRERYWKLVRQINYEATRDRERRLDCADWTEYYNAFPICFVEVFVDTALEVCVARNALRVSEKVESMSSFIPDEVIRQLHAAREQESESILSDPVELFFSLAECCETNGKEESSCSCNESEKAIKSIRWSTCRSNSRWPIIRARMVENDTLLSQNAAENANILARAFLGSIRPRRDYRVGSVASHEDIDVASIQIVCSSFNRRYGAVDSSLNSLCEESAYGAVETLIAAEEKEFAAQRDRDNESQLHAFDLRMRAVISDAFHSATTTRKKGTGSDPDSMKRLSVSSGKLKREYMEKARKLSASIHDMMAHDSTRGNSSRNTSDQVNQELKALLHQFVAELEKKMVD